MDEGSDKFGSGADICEGFFLLSLKVLLEWVKLTNILFCLVLQLEEFFKEISEPVLRDLRY